MNNVKLPSERDSEPSYIKEEPLCLIWRACLKDGTPVVAKLYRHRGLFNFLRGKLFQFRAGREFEALKILESNLVPCSRPLGWEKGYSRNYGFYELLITEERVDTESIREVLDSHWEVLSDSGNLKELFAVIRKMHELGVYHGHLGPKNVLFRRNREGKAEYFLIDLPRVKHFSRSIAGTDIALYDLMKAVAKLERRLGYRFCEKILTEVYGLDEHGVERLYKASGYLQQKEKTDKISRISYNVKVFMKALLTRVKHLCTAEAGKGKAG